ncbi:MAG: hypothetical protein Q8Q25_03105, partial [bacterium]|nr:hypothetical protein [bacterium]
FFSISFCLVGQGSSSEQLRYNSPIRVSSSSERWAFQLLQQEGISCVAEQAEDPSKNDKNQLSGRGGVSKKGMALFFLGLALMLLHSFGLYAGKEESALEQEELSTITRGRAMSDSCIIQINPPAVSEALRKRIPSPEPLLESLESLEARAKDDITNVALLDAIKKLQKENAATDITNKALLSALEKLETTRDEDLREAKRSAKLSYRVSVLGACVGCVGCVSSTIGAVLSYYTIADYFGK